VREELGIDLQVGRLLVVDWMPPYLGWEDAIEMIFADGTVDENDLAYWSLQPTEIKAVALLDLATASEFDSAGLPPTQPGRRPRPR
jgi:8-oxo-dGTP diphosphatase